LQTTAYMHIDSLLYGLNLNLSRKEGLTIFYQSATEGVKTIKLFTFTYACDIEKLNNEGRVP